jgi:hypothetical protein
LQEGAFIMGRKIVAALAAWVMVVNLCSVTANAGVARSLFTDVEMNWSATRSQAAFSDYFAIPEGASGTVSCSVYASNLKAGTKLQLYRVSGSGLEKAGTTFRVYPQAGTVSFHYTSLEEGTYFWGISSESADEISYGHFSATVTWEKLSENSLPLN